MNNKKKEKKQMVTCKTNFSRPLIQVSLGTWHQKREVWIQLTASPSLLLCFLFWFPTIYMYIPFT